MPRTKKAAGQAVDRRNGRRTELAAAERLRKFGLPRRDGPGACSSCCTPLPAWDPETRKAWMALWRDPISSLLSIADRPILLRWAAAIDRAVRLIREADAAPIATGSQGQPVANPLYDVAAQSLKVAQACEAQIGIGALNRARLGLEFTSAQRSLAELNATLGGSEGEDESDPRLG